MHPVLLLYDCSLQKVLISNNNNNNNNNQYNFFGAREMVRQEERMSLECAAKEFLGRMSIIRSSPLSDYSRITASNQFVLQVLGYLMWTQHWPVTELEKLEREALLLERPFANT